MNIIITNEQLDKLIPLEDIEFVKKYKEQTGHYPKFRELQNNPAKVGDYIPTHSKKNIGLKRYVDKYLGKYLNYINSNLASKSEESFEKGPVGSRNYISIDGKHVLRSELEALTYNIFVLENLQDEIEVDSKIFLKSCNKIPDFVWENKKIIIEVAGREDEGYKNKLEDAEDCFKKMGYKVYVINARAFEKQGKYVNYYLYLCDLLGFEPKQEVIESPYKYLGYKDVDRKFRQKYIDNNINKLPLNFTQQYTLNKYLNQLYGYGIKEYKKRNDMKRFRNSPDKKEIQQFKTEHPNLSNKEIADYFGVSKNTVQRITFGNEGLDK
jgi:very-short-patch-repair endonuclease